MFNKGGNILLSSAAGCGKSYTINYICEQFKKTQNDSIFPIHCGEFVICASTGIASVLIGGTTFHSFAGIGLGEESVEYYMKKMSPYAKERWRCVKVLIIDEISMLDPEYFSKCNDIAKLVRRSHKPFGGIQLLLSGDFLQLPPINSDISYIFKHKAWKECNIITVQLFKNMRQRNDVWSNILKEIRLGYCSESTIDTLNTRIKVFESTNDLYEIKPTKIYPIKDTVNRINIDEIKKLDGIKLYESSWSMNSILNGALINCNMGLELSTIPQKYNKHIKYMQLMERLPLAIGAQVMLTINLDIINGLANGSRGVVSGVNNDYIEVKFLSSNNIHKISRHMFECKINTKETLYVRQFPLLLAYATTIHKCQGMTLDCVQVDLTDCFEYGMVYVALSRCRNLDSLYIEAIDYTKIKAHKDALEFYSD